MTNEEFLNEVLSSEICPPNFESVYLDFCKYQQETIKTLAEFHRVCEKCGIKYQLAYGSLLGAIRDNGQIPWDYDVDVFVPYRDRLELIDALRNELGEEFYFYCPEIDPKCRHFFIRLAPKGYRTTALHVDVFFVIGVPEDEYERKQFCKKVSTVFRMRYTKLVNIAEECMGRPRTWLKLILNRIKIIHKPLKIVEKEYHEYCTRYDFNCSRYSSVADDECSKFYFETNKMWDTILVNTSIGEYRIPRNYNEILSAIYKNYTKVLPLERRIDELLESYSRLKYFDLH